MRVLLVEDDLSIRTVLWRELKVAFDVVVSPDAAHASRVMQGEPELVAVVTDYELGDGANGLAVLREAALRHPSAFRLMVSGWDGMRALAAAHPDLIDMWLPKPWPRSGVREAVISFLSATKKLALGSDAVPRVAKQPAAQPVQGTANAMVEVDLKFTDWSLFRLVHATRVDLGGMVLPMKEEPTPGQELSLSLQLPGGGQTTIVSRVARVQRNDELGAYEVSVEFTRLTNEQREGLMELILRSNKGR